MNVKDILVGDESVLVKTNKDNFEFERDEYGMISVDDSISDGIRNELVKHNAVTVKEFPKTINFFVHDEGTSYDRKVVSDKLDLPKDHSMVKRISNIGYEVEFTISVENQNGRFVAYITDIMGEELAEPKKLY